MPKRSAGRRWLGLLALAVAIGLAVSGVLGRRQSDAKLETWTKAQAVPTVAIVTPRPEDGVEKVVLPGTVQAWFDAPIYARVSGYLKSWRRDIGASVKQGETLATIDTPDLDQQLAQARANLASAAADAKLSALTAGRWKSLLRSNSVSQQASDEKAGDATTKAAAVQAAQANVDRLQALESFRTIVAPFDGVVTARRTDIGALIDAGSGRGPELFRVADLHAMRVYVDVPQSYAAQLKPGLSAQLRLPQFPNRDFPARLVTTSNAVDERSRAVLAELEAANADRTLWPGAYAQVTFDLPPAPGLLQIPASAIIFQEGGTEVAVVDHDVAALKHVTLGRDLGTAIEVLSGLAASDQVINSPPDDLSNGDHVRIAK